MLNPSISFVVASLLLMCPLAMAHAQQREQPFLYVARTLGFRPATFMTLQSDYTFEVSDDGQWKYRAFAGRKDGPYLRSGKLPMALEALEQQLQELGIQEIPEEDPNAPKIADLPTLGIRRQVDGEPWVREIRPNDPQAMRLHYLIQSIVMGVRELPPDEFPLKDAESLGVEKPLKITDQEGLESAFGTGDTATALAKSVDFDTQSLVVFRWAGSGRDELFAYLGGQDNGEVLVFGYRPGLTRDLRQHARYYIVPKKMEWKFEQIPQAKFE